MSNHGAGYQNSATRYGPQFNLNGAGTQNYHVHTVPFAPPQHAESLVPSSRPPASRDDFHVALICALPLEYDAVVLQLDKIWDEDGKRYGRARGDRNIYITGRIVNHNVVVALLPAIGKAAAAGRTASLRSSYPRLELALLVGICGGVPDQGENGAALMGDVVISQAVLQFDFGRQFPTKFVPKDTVDDNMGRADGHVRSLIAIFETDYIRTRLRKQASDDLRSLQAKTTGREGVPDKYRYPGLENDKLFEASYLHEHRASSWCFKCRKNEYCERAAKKSCVELKCEEERLVDRKGQSRMTCGIYSPQIFMGRIGSGDTVMKSGVQRDQLAKEHDLVAFEMEGAGVWDELPCLIVKGICDYADSHKDKKWQPFAAATAACMMKAILGQYDVTDS
ncbi:purine and uridine phosphorylase [Nemania sp. NC0429]|nr:purine and uridine phosphorylase [Nemania sp. NC0429]